MDESEPDARPVSIEVDAQRRTSGLFLLPDDACACYVLAHGAGAGMRHAFLEGIARGLARRRIATLRFQFPFMEAGSARPDPPPVAHAAVRAAVEQAAMLAPGLPLFAGGRSFGGRMTSQAQAETPLSNVTGLIFLGFPLHPAKKPAITRADHLSRVRTPMLFVQGDRDALADFDLLRPIVTALGASLVLVEGGDHGFRVPARMHRSERHVMDAVLDEIQAWISTLVPNVLKSGA